MFPIGDDNSGRRTVPLVTYALIALNVLFFFVELSGGDAFIKRWAFVPDRFLANPFGDSLMLFTSMFMHAGWVHLGGNKTDETTHQAQRLLDRQDRLGAPQIPRRRVFDPQGLDLQFLPSRGGEDRRDRYGLGALRQGVCREP